MRVLPALALMAALLSPATVQAQRGVARQLTRDAVSEFDRGNYAEARALFLRAHEAEPSARLLRGAALASFELREYALALRHLQAALDETRRALTPRQRREAEELLSRTRTFLGRFRIALDPADAELTIDLRPVEPEPDGSLLLGVGEYALAARAPGHEPLERRLTVRGGEDDELRLTMTPTPIALTHDPPREDVPLDPPPPRPRTLEAALLISGGALLLSTIAGAVWWRGRRVETDRCVTANAMAGASCLNLDVLQRQSRAAGATTILLAAAGLTMLTAGILRLTWGQEDDERTIACGFGGCSWQRRF
ncbi:MAG: hypothetical protein KF901_24855 [Myxococcales bacterium]|nr:hypothetical protein [Myxococcales bacterium]